MFPSESIQFLLEQKLVESLQAYSFIGEKLCFSHLGVINEV